MNRIKKMFDAYRARRIEARWKCIIQTELYAKGTPQEWYAVYEKMVPRIAQTVRGFDDCDQLVQQVLFSAGCGTIRNLMSRIPHGGELHTLCEVTSTDIETVLYNCVSNFIGSMR